MIVVDVRGWLLSANGAQPVLLAEHVIRLSGRDPVPTRQVVRP
jgi:hypothetical protein